MTFFSVFGFKWWWDLTEKKKNLILKKNITDFLVSCPANVTIQHANATQNASYVPTFATCNSAVNVTQNCTTRKDNFFFNFFFFWFIFDLCPKLKQTKLATTDGIYPTTAFVCRNVEVSIANCRGGSCISPTSRSVAQLVTKG